MIATSPEYTIHTFLLLLCIIIIIMHKLIMPRLARCELNSAEL
jgi:hypothetical protein